MKRYLAVDPGLRWVGLAHSDASGTISTPYEVVDRDNQSLKDILDRVVKEKSIDTVVVGYPDPLKTDRNERTRQVDQFIEEFLDPLPVPIEVVSERYSTREAERLRKLRDQSEPAEDDEAAALILEFFLNQNQQSVQPPSGHTETNPDSNPTSHS